MKKIHSVLVVIFFVQLLTAQNTIGLQIGGNQTVLFGDSTDIWSSKLLWYPDRELLSGQDMPVVRHGMRQTPGFIPLPPE